jgi:AraC family transcriptional regulator, arabinose operon regulatory protein
VDVSENHDWWLLILTHTPAKFLINNQLIQYPAGCMVLYPPESRIYYQGCSDSYKNDWIRFYSTESYIINSKIPAGIPIKLPNPGYCHNLFQLLAEENFYNFQCREQSIENLFRLLFNKLTEAACSIDDNVNSKYQELSILRSEIKNNPGFPWSIPFMAKRLHFSEGHFQAVYRRAFNTSCMDDVIQNRILLAKEHLALSTYTIGEIAVICGYNHVEHFSRQFRQIVGKTPKQFRMEETKRAFVQ